MYDEPPLDIMADAPPPEDPAASAERTLDPETTVLLLQRLQSGDADARELLLSRVLPPLTRWAHGRLSPYLRSSHETADLVQEAAMRVLPHLDRFEIRHQGALQAYLRRTVANRIIELARVKRPEAIVEIPEDLADGRQSPLAQAIGAETVQRYERAFAGLSDADQQAIHLRYELGFSHDEVAVALDKPSVDAARVAVKRATHRLAVAMEELERRHE